MSCAEWFTSVDSRRLSTVELKWKAFLAVDSGACRTCLSDGACERCFAAYIISSLRHPVLPVDAYGSLIRTLSPYFLFAFAEYPGAFFCRRGIFLP
eukprot:1185274-Prorocentrum_minimum.AAC.5